MGISVMESDRNVCKTIINASFIAVVSFGAFSPLLTGCAPRASALPPNDASATGHRTCTETYPGDSEKDNEDASPGAGQGCQGSPSGAIADKPAKLEVTSVFYEAHGPDTRAKGVSYRELPPGAGRFGLDFENIWSPDITYRGEPETLTSVYIAAGASFDWWASPYVEGGIDLGDIIGAYIHEEAGLCDSENDDENSDHCKDIDMFGAIGIETKPIKYFPLVRWYWKTYLILQEGRTEYVPVTGVSLGWTY